MTDRITLVTPSYAKDFERFCLQRESIERCCIDLPHMALVNHEDVVLFENVPFKRNLRIASTREVFPPRIEARRLAWGARRRELRYWKGRNPIHGWMAQQLLKLGAAEHIAGDAMVCLDSDTFFVDTVVSSDFYAEDGRLHLYETESDLDAEMAEWYVRSLRFLGIPLQNTPVRRFTHSPVPLHRAVVLEMTRFIEQRHGKHWMDAMLDAEQIFEYSTYGAYARHIEGATRVAPVRPGLCLYYWWREELNSVKKSLLKRLDAEPATKAVLINSNGNIPVSAYRELVEAAWARSQSARDWASGIRVG